MAEYLSSDISRHFNIDARIDHLEWGPVFVVHQIFDELGRCCVIVFVIGVRHPRHLSNKFVAIRGRPDQFSFYFFNPIVILPGARVRLLRMLLRVRAGF